MGKRHRNRSKSKGRSGEGPSRSSGKEGRKGEEEKMEVVGDSEEEGKGEGSIRSVKNVVEVKGMSTFDLMINPVTLQAGMNLLQQNWNDNQKAEDSLSDDYATTTAVDDSNTDGPRRSKRKKKKKDKKEDIVAPSRDKKGRVDQNRKEKEDGKGRRGRDKDKDGEGDEENHEDGISRSKVKGAAMFEELTDRYAKSQQKSRPKSDGLTRSGNIPYKNRDLDEFNIPPDDAVMRALYPDFDKKVELAAEHEKRIKELTEEDALNALEKIKPDLTNIFREKIPSERFELYCSEDKKDRDILKGRVLSPPYTSEIFSTISNAVIDRVLVKKREKSRYREFALYVLIPEALIRIYALINDVDIKTAETEMQYGALYDGPVYKKNRKSKSSSKGKKKRKQDAESPDLAEPTHHQVEEDIDGYH